MWDLVSWIALGLPPRGGRLVRLDRAASGRAAAGSPWSALRGL